MIAFLILLLLLLVFFPWLIIPLIELFGAIVIVYVIYKIFQYVFQLPRH